MATETKVSWKFEQNRVYLDSSDLMLALTKSIPTSTNEYRTEALNQTIDFVRGLQEEAISKSKPEKNGCEDHLTCYGCQDKNCSGYREPSKEKTLTDMDWDKAMVTQQADLSKDDHDKQVSIYCPLKPKEVLINGFEHEQLIAKYAELQQTANENYSKCVMLIDRVAMLEAELEEYVWISIDERLPKDSKVYEWLKKDGKIIFSFAQAMIAGRPEEMKNCIKSLGYTYWRPAQLLVDNETEVKE